MSKETKCLNPGCGKKLKQTKGKRAKSYCTSTCRSNHFQKRQRAVKESLPVVDDNNGAGALGMVVSKNKVSPAIKSKISAARLVGIQSKTKKGAKEKFDEITDKIKSGKIKPTITFSTPPDKLDGSNTIWMEIDEAANQMSAPQKPTSLQQVKDLCPKELKGLDRSAWIASERKKYNI